MNGYPTKEKLKKMWWYRLFLVIRLLLVILTFFAPLTREINHSSLWFVDGIIGALLVWIILWIFWIVLKYIIFGKAPKQKKEKKSEYIDTKSEYIDIKEIVNKRMKEKGLDKKKNWQEYYKIRKEVELENKK